MKRIVTLIAAIVLFGSPTLAQRFTEFHGWGFSAKRLRGDSLLLIPTDTSFSKTGIAQ